MALLVSFSVKKGNEGIGVWLHFGYSLNEEAATSFLSRVILMPYRFDSGLRHFLQYAYIGKRLKNPVKSRFSVVFCFSVPEQNGKILPLFCPFKIR